MVTFQDSNLILAEEKVFFDSLIDDEERSDSNESVVSEESFCMTQTRDVPEGDTKSGEVLLSIVKHEKQANYVCLLDTGTSQPTVDERLANSKTTVKSKWKTFWETKGGKFSTSKRERRAFQR